MKNVIIILALVFFALFLLVDKKSENTKPIIETYPWQVKVLADGRTRVFGIVLGESPLKMADVILKSTPEISLFEVNGHLALEAYYKNIALGGLIGSFIFTLDVPAEELLKIKEESTKQKPAENKGKRYDLDKPTSDRSKSFIIKNLIYIPTAQLDEKTIVQRFGNPAYKIKLKTKEAGWHYLYPDKGLDLIFKEEGKEVLQYILPKDFNLLLEPLQDH